MSGFTQSGNFIYPRYKGALLIGGSNLSLASGTARAALLSAGYVVNSLTDQWLGDVPGTAIVATSGPLSG